MNFNEALELVKKEKKGLSEKSCIAAVAHTPGDLDGEFHVFTLSYFEDEDEDGNLCDWFSVDLNAGSIESPSSGVEGDWGGSTIEELKENLDEDGVLKLLSTLNFKIMQCGSTEFFMTTSDHCLKLFFGNEIGDNDFMSRQDEQRFRKEAISLIQKFNALI